jgi:hypothetical protein
MGLPEHIPNHGIAGSHDPAGQRPAANLTALAAKQVKSALPMAVGGLSHEVTL